MTTPLSSLEAVGFQSQVNEEVQARSLLASSPALTKLATLEPKRTLLPTNSLARATSPQNSTDSNFNQARAFQENETNPADDAAPVANNDQDPPSDNSEANGNAQFAAHAIAIQPDQAPAALDYQGDDEISVGDRQAPALDIQHQQDNISLDNASHNSFRFSIFSDNSASNYYMRSPTILLQDRLNWVLNRTI